MVLLISASHKCGVENTYDQVLLGLATHYMKKMILSRIRQCFFQVG